MNPKALNPILKIIEENPCLEVTVGHQTDISIEPSEAWYHIKKNIRSVEVAIIFNQVLDEAVKIFMEALGEKVMSSQLHQPVAQGKRVLEHMLDHSTITVGKHTQKTFQQIVISLLLEHVAELISVGIQFEVIPPYEKKVGTVNVVEKLEAFRKRLQGKRP